jgi:hypothetical protein
MKKNKSETQNKNETIFKEDKEAFVYFFSHLDNSGLSSILKDDNQYDDLSKNYWITLFEEQFKSFKEQNIRFLQPIPGSCIGCKKGCSGFTFLNENSGFYVDLVIESNTTEIVDFTDCVNLENEILGLNKKEQIFMNEKDLYGVSQEFPF